MSHMLDIIYFEDIVVGGMTEIFEVESDKMGGNFSIATGVQVQLYDYQHRTPAVVLHLEISTIL